MNITIDIPDEINRQLSEMNNINAFVVSALEMALTMQAQTAADDPLLQLSGMLTFGPGDIGENHDDYIGQSIRND